MPRSDSPPPAPAGRAQRSTPERLRNLRHLRVMVFHPRDADGEMIVQQLRRIGCQVFDCWPPLTALPDTVDAVFCAVRPDGLGADCAWTREPRTPAVIAVVSYENPTIVDAVLRLGATGVIASPVRSAGILSALVVAQRANDEATEQRRRIQRLEQKLQSANQISEAKLILMRTRSVSDGDAYRIIREQAMSRRVPTEEVARAIIEAHAVLSFPVEDRPGT